MAAAELHVGIDASKLCAPRDGLGSYVRSLLRAFTVLQMREPPDAPTWTLHLYGMGAALDAGVVLGALGAAPSSRLRIADAPTPRARHGLDLFHATTLALPAGWRGPLLVTGYDLTFLSHPETHTLDNRLHCLTGTLA
ncbi:MAG: hypothetical protein AAF772_14570, partial [Acidobacteriota bacterium]